MSKPAPDLPIAVSNNAVAALRAPDGQVWLYSFMGLKAGKSWRDTTSAAFVLPPDADGWSALADVPGGEGRLAGVAAAAAGSVYIFGGYTVKEDHSEVSVASVHALRQGANAYVRRAAMPVPVDDAVAVVYQDRYIYLISGWHDFANVNLVQMYDTRTDSWAQATAFPGTPVFGHAGGMVDDTIIVCDGVGIHTPDVGARRFVPVDACYSGEVDAGNPRRITWHRLPSHPGPARYRMAATGVTGAPARVVFAGGSDNPYNYNGIGYNGEPSAASDEVFAFDVSARAWQRLGHLPVATMDHRGLLTTDAGLVLVGGMREGQRVSAQVLHFSLNTSAQ